MHRFAIFLPFLSALLSCMILSVVMKAEPTWTEVRSPHFRVLTDGSGRDGRNVAKEFEQMRHVFSQRFGNDQFESGAPLTILAGRDLSILRRVESAFLKAQGGNVAGVFHRGWEKQYAVIRLDTWSDQNQVVVYHEYTHSVLHANARWLPTWLDEGMAEFYAYTRFQGDKTYLGAPSMRLRELRDRPLIPIGTILAVTPRSPYYHDDVKVQIFYAQAWAMVHYMTFAPGMEGGAKLNTFLKLLQEGNPQQKAFEQVFGDPRAFERSLSQYLQHFVFSAGVLPPGPGLDPKTFLERRLSPAEVEFEIGGVQIGAHDRAAGRASLERSLAMEPKLAGAHEELGFLDFEDGKDAEAAKEWTTALDLDASLARSLFAVTMSGPAFDRRSPQELVATGRTLRHVVELAPKFAPAYVELALLEWRAGSLQQAYKDSHQAELLEPWRAGYRLLTARILLQGHQPALAATSSRYVAAHWFGPDHNEAVDLWQAVPATMRGEEPAPVLDMPSGAEIVRGRLKEVSCGGGMGAGKIRVTLLPEAPANPEPLTMTSSGRMSLGFSDTLWWGEDHFSACHHLDGHQAVIAYKAHAAGDATGGELLDLEIRDDLPSSSAAVTSAKTDPVPVPPAQP